MSDVLDQLRRLVNADPAQIIVTIKSIEAQIRERISDLRNIVNCDTLSQIQSGPAADIRLLRTALMAIVATNVSLHDPSQKPIQLKNLRAACHELGIRYEEATRLTVYEDRLTHVLFEVGSI
ncbi:MAG TPA: hypothetical protein VJZ71_11035 [Phycisphaerae bacterium]|nr:hypothetical protein [Phycisphaerae bacterium]